MAGRIRTLKPEWLEDERLLEAGSDSRVLSVALILLADDSGRGRVTVVTGATVFPLDSRVFREALARLRGWFVRLYEVRGQRYFEIVNWRKHQRIDRPSKPRTPEPSEGTYLDPPPDEPDPPAGDGRPSRDPRETLAPDPDPDPDPDLDQDPDVGRARAREAPHVDDGPAGSSTNLVPIGEPRTHVVAHRAYRSAIEDRGGIFMGGGGQWRPAFEAVGRAAAEVVERRGGTLEAVLEGWAQRYVAERKRHRPDWWVEQVTLWLAEGAPPATPQGQIPGHHNEPARGPQRPSLNQLAEARALPEGRAWKRLVAKRGGDPEAVGREAALAANAHLTDADRAEIRAAGDEAQRRMIAAWQRDRDEWRKTRGRAS